MKLMEMEMGREGIQLKVSILFSYKSRLNLSETLSAQSQSTGVVSHDDDVGSRNWVVEKD